MDNKNAKYVCVCVYNEISFFKKRVILSFTVIQMYLEGIILSEINQTESDKYYMESLTCTILKKKKLL